MPSPLARRRRRPQRRKLQRSFETCASGRAPVSEFPDVLVWTTTPSSRAHCSESGPSLRAWARASSSALPTTVTRTPTPMWSGPTASSTTRYAPTPTAARTTGTVNDSHLTLAEFVINNAASTLGDDLTPFRSSSTAAHIRVLAFRSCRRTTTAPLASRRRCMCSGCRRWSTRCWSSSRRRWRSGRRSST